MPDCDAVRYTTCGPVATLTIDRGARRNAFTVTMVAQLLAGVARAGADDAVRVLVIRGDGGSFSSGTDLSDPQEIGAAHEQLWRVMRETGGWWPITACPKPVIAAVDGPAIGLGAELASHCDVRIATDRAWFHWNFAERGLVADTGAGTWLLPRLIGAARALELLLRARPLPAAEALAIGYVADVVAPDSLDATVDEAAERLATLSQLSARLTKELLYEGLRRNPAAHLDAQVRAFEHCLASSDHREGVAAFHERRSPQFEDGATTR